MNNHRCVAALACFDHWLTLAPHERESWAESLCCQDPQLGRELNELIHADQQVSQHCQDLFAPLPLDEDYRRGQQLGPWRVQQLIGSGGIGSVYLGHRHTLQGGQYAAIKTLRFDNPMLHELIQAERRALAKLDHHGVARLLDFGTDPQGSPYIATEYVAGCDLLEHCRVHKLDSAAMIELLLQLIETLAVVHRCGIVHGDIKPANLLVTRQGKVKLLDFGIARNHSKASMLRHSSRISVHQMMTPEYASPEQRQGKSLTPASDIYALGALVQRMLLQRPSAWRDSGALVGMQNLSKRAMASNPLQRYRNCEAMASQLRRLLPTRRSVMPAWHGFDECAQHAGMGR